MQGIFKFWVDLKLKYWRNLTNTSWPIRGHNLAALSYTYITYMNINFIPDCFVLCAVSLFNVNTITLIRATVINPSCSRWQYLSFVIILNKQEKQISVKFTVSHTFKAKSCSFMTWQVTSLLLLLALYHEPLCRLHTFYRTEQRVIALQWIKNRSTSIHQSIQLSIHPSMLWINRRSGWEDGAGGQGRVSMHRRILAPRCV